MDKYYTGIYMGGPAVFKRGTMTVTPCDSIEEADGIAKAWNEGKLVAPTN